MRIQLMCLCLMALCVLRPAFAQDAATQTFTSKDGTFSFEYPVGWFADESETSNPPHEIMINNLSGAESVTSSEGFFIAISSPTKFYTIPMSKAETPKEMVERSIILARIEEGLKGSSGSGPVILSDGTPQALPTPTMPQSTPNPPQVTEFTVNNRSAAYGYVNASVQIKGLDNRLLMIVVDLGDDYWTTISAGSVLGGLKTVEQNKEAVLGIVQSLRYTPPMPVNSGNPDLPRVYSGPDGIWQFGTVEFYYPDNWNISTSSLLAFSNTNAFEGDPVSGQFIGEIHGVAETLARIDPSEAENILCGVIKTPWTARSFVDKIFTEILPGQLEELTNKGTTITQPETVTINGVEMIYFRTFQKDFEYLSIIIDLGDSNIVSLIVQAVRGEMAYFENQIFQVSSTLRYTPKTPDTCLTAVPEDDGILIPTPQN